METEEWRTIPGFSKNYIVSNLGRVRTRVRRGPTRKVLVSYWKVTGGHLAKDGYWQVNIALSNGKRDSCPIHRLVALAFLPTTEGFNTVHHKNACTTDNRKENLEWTNTSGNIKYFWERNQTRLETLESIFNEIFNSWIF